MLLIVIIALVIKITLLKTNKVDCCLKNQTKTQ